MSVRGRSARYGTLTLLLAALLVLAACSSGSPSSSGSSAGANSLIAIGYELPLTGTAAVAGKTTPITAPRGPVRIDASVDAPIQNIYVCKVENVHGTLQNVPIKIYPEVQPWGTLPPPVWATEYAANSVGRPSP
jgi:hypothetical protein